MNENETIASAMNILARNKILSCPVVWSSTHGPRLSGDFLGVVDAENLVRNFIKDLQTSGSAAWANATELLAAPADQRAALVALGSKYVLVPILSTSSHLFYKGMKLNK